MREPKAHLSELVRAAANGELIVLTDYGKPLAVITSMEGEGANRADDSADASKFTQALLALPAPTLDKWLDGLVATFGHVIHPVDVKVAMRAGELMRSWRGGALGAGGFPSIVSMTCCLLRRRRSMAIAY